MWYLRGPSKTPQQMFTGPPPDTLTSRCASHSCLITASDTFPGDTLRGPSALACLWGSLVWLEADRDTEKLPSQVQKGQWEQLPGVAPGGGHTPAE